MAVCDIIKSQELQLTARQVQTAAARRNRVSACTRMYCSCTLTQYFKKTKCVTLPILIALFFLSLFFYRCFFFFFCFTCEANLKKLFCVSRCGPPRTTWPTPTQKETSILKRTLGLLNIEVSLLCACTSKAFGSYATSKQSSSRQRLRLTAA